MEIRMFKALLVVVTMLAMSQANATTTLLTGSIEIVNPAASWKAPQTVNYNAVYGTSAKCEAAKTAAIQAPVSVYPTNATGSFGTFYKIEQLTCTTK